MIKPEGSLLAPTVVDGLKRLADRAWPILFCTAGLLAAVLPSLQDGRFPGDIIDARFNNFVLEHVCRWLQGLELSLWSPAFFFPFQHVLAFSDNLLGSVPVYWAFRELGVNRWSAYQGWYLVGFVLNFLTCHISLNRLGFQSIASAFGAFVFTFALPVFGEEFHVQLLYRCGVPIAMVAVHEFGTTRRLSRLAWLAAALAWQFFAAIYLGLFLTVMIVLALIATAIVERDAAGFVRYWPLRLASAWRDATGRTRWTTVLVIAIALAALVALLIPYYQVTEEYRFRRDWAEISTLLPRPWSYLISDYTSAWSWVRQFLPDVPMPYEQQLFFGAVPLYLAARGLISPTGATRRRLAYGSAVTLLGLILLTVMIDGWSPYALLSLLPGFSAIRGVTRIVLVMLMPLAILGAIGVESVLNAADRRPHGYGRVLLLFIGALIEVLSIHHWTDDLQLWQGRIDALAARLPAAMPDDPILYAARQPGDNPSGADLDAMFLAQERGWKTVNGYSGNFPPGFQYSGRCVTGKQLLADYFTYSHLPLGEEYRNEAARLVTICSEAAAKP